MKHLRTFLPLKDRHWVGPPNYLSPTVLDVITNKLKYLRVLALPYAIGELPISIDCLKHLRYLDLSHANIYELPKSLCKLFNLEALILFGCGNLLKLPEDFCDLINLQFLDIRDTDRLEMPLHIGELKKLHILGKFVVGRSDGCRMLKLLKIPNFQGQQHISALENVTNVKDVDRWEMKHLAGIDGLTLEWCERLDDSRDEKIEEVLGALKPQKNITKLSINFYGGRELPSWIGDPHFGKMKTLMLKDCYKVASLPALGQLTSLEELTLEGMNGIKEVGMSLYGNVTSSANVFPSLKTLRIKKMEELYEWSNFSIDEASRYVFSKLKKLELRNCPKLEVCSFPSPVLDELVVCGCKEVILRSLPYPQSLTKLKIENIAGLESFNKEFLEALVSLQEMNVGYCGELKHLWKDEFNMDRLSQLKILKIKFCDELVSFVEEDEGNCPLNLQTLFVRCCKKLETLPNQLHSLTSLTYLTVRECPKLKTFPRRGLSNSVKRVRVWSCDSLESVGEGIIVDIDNSNSGHLSQIEVLHIIKCEALNIPSNLGFSASLRNLYIESSPVEAQLFRSLQQQNGLSHLTYLTIWTCPNLESFPDTTTLIPSLLKLILRECEKLRALPNHFNQFTSLQTLVMNDCPQLASFPEGGLPTSLKQLDICFCDKLESKVLLERSLNVLTCLEDLKIRVARGMEDVNSFPYDSLLLPTTLTSLIIVGFRNLKSISTGIQRLASLETLIIEQCPRLQSLPRVASLGRLMIYECPLLEKQFRKREGDFWDFVSSIPLFEICERRWSITPQRLLNK